MPAMPAATSDQFLGNSNLHEPFLRRAADATDGHTSGVALGGFLTLRLVDVFGPRFETMSAEALAYQIQATRDYLGDLHPSTVEVKHLIEIVRASQSAFEQRNRRVLWPSLLAFAFWLEQELRLDEALDVLDAAMALSDGVKAEEEVATLLQRARVLRLSGQLDAASEGYAAAGRLAMTCGDTHSELLSRIGRGIVLQVRGNLPESQRVLKQALNDAVTQGDREAEARASHDLAVTCYSMELFSEGIPLAFRAYELYDQETSRLRALSDLGQLLIGIRELDAAEDAFQIVVGRASQVDVTANALNELMEVASRKGDRVGFERSRKSVSALLDRIPPEVHVDYLLKLGEGLARLSDRGRAREQLRAAADLARTHGMHQYAFRADRTLKEIETEADRPRIITEKATGVRSGPEIATVANRLHKLRVALVA